MFLRLTADHIGRVWEKLMCLQRDATIPAYGRRGKRTTKVNRFPFPMIMPDSVSPWRGSKTLTQRRWLSLKALSTGDVAQKDQSLYHNRMVGFTACFMVPVSNPSPQLLLSEAPALKSSSIPWPIRNLYPSPLVNTWKITSSLPEN